MKNICTALIFLLLASFVVSCSVLDSENKSNGKTDCRTPGSVFAIAYSGDVTQLRNRQFSTQEINERVKGTGCNGWTPVIIASAEGHEAMVKELIQLGANVNATNPLGRSALMFASRYGYEQIAESLLKAGANPNLITENGPRKAVIAAAEQGHAAVILLNLKYGAKVSKKDCAGYENACVRIATVLASMQRVEESSQILRPICTEGGQVACHMLRLNQCLEENRMNPTVCKDNS